MTVADKLYDMVVGENEADFYLFLEPTEAAISAAVEEKVMQYLDESDLFDWYDVHTAESVLRQMDDHVHRVVCRIWGECWDRQLVQ